MSKDHIFKKYYARTNGFLVDLDRHTSGGNIINIIRNLKQKDEAVDPNDINMGHGKKLKQGFLKEFDSFFRELIEYFI